MHEEKQIEEEQAAKAQNQKLPVCYDDDDDKEESNSLKDNIISELPPCSAVTPSEPIDSLNVSEKIFSNPMFEEEIISIRIDQHHFNAESDLVESMLNRDSSVISSSSKIDSLLDKFVSELTLLKSIPPGIDKDDCHPKKEIRFFERLFDSHMEEIDLSFNPDDPMLLSIEDDDNDSEGDNLF
nr:hypothetical protein [Tanacetum cinerariifolium]